jgi:hypothetical protein
MWCDADPQETSKRSLAPDDIQGLCSIYPPGSAFLSNMGDSSDDDSCSVAGAGKTPLAGLGSALLVALALCLQSARARKNRALRRAPTAYPDGPSHVTAA